MMDTKHASAERTDSQTLRAQTQLLQERFAVDEVIENIPQILTILNEDRQIVYANQQLLQLLDLDGPESVYGKRPGEALGCIHAFESAGGCGTTEFCRECGAVNAILDAQRGQHSVKECRILTQSQDALDLRVWARPFQYREADYTVFTVVNIADEKRREALERTFFHDILNTAGNILSASTLLGTGEEEIKAQLSEIIKMSSGQLVSEIRSHRMLLQAENGNLAVDLQPLDSAALLQKVIGGYSLSHLAKEKVIRHHPDSVITIIKSDEALLSRILGNLLKNALEASEVSETITLRADQVEDEIHFSVHNPKQMPRKVELQVFQRSFSTKGAGRGIGTYSVKLFAERYLGGRVWFTTDAEAGTTFTLALPRNVD